MSATPEREQFMRRAIELARSGMETGQGGPFGAVIVRDGEVVGEGANRVLADNDPTAHGEIVAIRDACRRLGAFKLRGCEIYSIAEPCPMCLGAIYWARLDRLYFGVNLDEAAAAGFDDARIYSELARPADRRRLPSTQMLAAEAAQVFRRYAAKPDRVPY